MPNDDKEIHEDRTDIHLNDDNHDDDNGDSSERRVFFIYIIIHIITFLSFINMARTLFL